MRYEFLSRRGHILANPANWQVLAHRLILFEKIGDGDHPCYVCGKTVTWGHRGVRGTLVVDHLNDDKLDNRPENLSPTCHSCNIKKSHRRRVRDDEEFVVHPQGFRMRGTTIVCEFCKETKVVRTVEVRTGTVRYCSRKCGNTAKARARWA